MLVYEMILKELLAEFGVEFWRTGAKDFVDLVIALKVDMGFGGQGRYDLAGEALRLAKARGVPLRWYYGGMKAAVLPLLEVSTERLEALGIEPPPPNKRTTTAMAVAVARWLWSIEVS